MQKITSLFKKLINIGDKKSYKIRRNKHFKNFTYFKPTKKSNLLTTNAKKTLNCFVKS